MSDRAKTAALTRRTVVVRAVVTALVSELISDGVAVEPDRVARLGLLGFDEEELQGEPLLQKAALERFVRELVGKWRSADDASAAIVAGEGVAQPS